VLALGRPGGSGLQATLGIISARQEAQDGGRPEYLLHTDATLYPGFSGGPLVNVQGQIVGLTNLSFGRGMGLALGLPILTHVAESLLAGGAVKRGYLGVSTQSVPLPESLKAALGLTQERGLLVVQVESGGPADAAGLQLGDTVLGLNGQALDDVDGLRRHLRGLSAGQAVTLRLARGGAAHELAVTLGVRE
jgi:S1-C subfamily serine protease